MLRTKVDEIGCYYRKKMIFSKFSKNHFQKSRVSPENRFRISRYFIQPKTKKTRGTDRNPAQPRPKPLLLIDWQWKSTLFQPKNKEEMTLFQDAATFTIAKKGNEAQNKPPQTSSRQKRQIPQADTQNAPQPTKQSQRKNISRFSGPTMRMESVPEGTPSLPFFKNWCFKPWKSTIYKNSKIIHFLNKVNILYNHLIFNNINFCPRMLSNFHLFTICKTLSVENNLIG